MKPQLVMHDKKEKKQKVKFQRTCICCKKKMGEGHENLCLEYMVKYDPTRVKGYSAVSKLTTNLPQ